MDIDDKIDQYLKKLFQDKNYTLYASDLYNDDFFTYNAPHPVDRAMISRGLIEMDKEARILTEFGIRVSQAGGWKQYLLHKEGMKKKESDTQSEMQALTKKQLELNIREMQVNFTQIKYWWLIWIITTVVSGILGALLQKYFTN